MYRSLSALCSVVIALASFTMAFTPGHIMASNDYYSTSCSGSCTNDAECVSASSACDQNSTRKNCLCLGVSPSKACDCG